MFLYGKVQCDECDPTAARNQPSFNDLTKGKDPNLQASATWQNKTLLLEKQPLAESAELSSYRFIMPSKFPSRINISFYNNIRVKFNIFPRMILSFWRSNVSISIE